MLCALAAVLLLDACAERTPQGEQTIADPVTLVDPFIGTGGHGHTYPGATVPFGMVQLSPDTRKDGWDGCSGYHFSDSVILGFSHTHLSGTGVSDYGDVLFMPMVDEAWSDLGMYGERGYPSRFKKSTEKAGAGWYSVHLEQGNVDVELTATTRCGLHRYTFTQDSGLVLIDLNHRDRLLGNELNVVSATEVEGYRASTAWARDQRVYFVAQFSAPISSHDARSAPSNADQTPVPTRFMLHFASLKGKQLLVRIGISAVSIANARQNLAAEIPGWDFDAVKKSAIDTWAQQLHKIEIAGGTPEQQKIFYTALYHTSIVPNLFSDVNGEYRGMDGKTHSAGKDQQYTVFSLWDTYRAAHPLYTIIDSKRNSAFIRSFLRMYQDGGRLPVWELAGNETDCMIGYHSVAVIADAYMKGQRDFDAALALQAMVHSADLDHFGLKYYKEQGFIGAGDESESVSKTLEYAYDDWCIAEMAYAMGQDSIASRFYKRAQNYKNLYDVETGFFRARINGCWQEPFDPREVNFNFTEANAWQYSLAVPQDIEGLRERKGGANKLQQHLDRLFTAETATTGREQADITGLIGQYAHGNEPSHHMAWLYNFTNTPHKTTERVHQILNEMYHTAPDGLSGNEDCGQMSAWYVMSAMGIYAVTPGRPEYNLCAPLFPYIKINLENGKTFEIVAKGVDAGKTKIQSARLNGKTLESLVIDHQTIMDGGKLEYEMGEFAYIKENMVSWAGPKPRMPKSRIAGPEIPTVPYFDRPHAGGAYPSETFLGLLQMLLVSPGNQVYYTTDGSVPTVNSRLANNFEFNLTESTVIDAISVDKSGNQSPVLHAEFHLIDPTRKIQVLTKYENQYAAGGDKALIDGLTGGPNFRTGRWQGYQGDMQVVVDLGSKKHVSDVTIGFLQDINSWIWMPKNVNVELSDDGRSWEWLGDAQSAIRDTTEGAQVDHLKVHATKPLPCQYIRVTATNYGICPPWHLGAGGKAWLFADEIVVDAH